MHLHGARHLCPLSAAALAEEVVRAEFTPREAQVLGLLCDGLDNKTIAQRLGLALSTVKTHVQALLAAGVPRAVINTGWLGAQIPAHFGDEFVLSAVLPSERSAIDSADCSPLTGQRALIVEVNKSVIVGLDNKATIQKMPMVIPSPTQQPVPLLKEDIPMKRWIVVLKDSESDRF